MAKYFNKCFKSNSTSYQRIDASSDFHVFTLKELKTITKNFSKTNFLGGFVHKGFIPHKLRPSLSAQPVAVKRLDLIVHNQAQENNIWLTQVLYIGKVEHVNLVKLIGCCCEKNENRFLVYEYMPLGTLENHLHHKIAVLPWSIRIKIALGAAKGLAYLHESEKPLFYRVFTASNILLDSDYTAKLSDYGLAIDGERVHNAPVLSIGGYVAPEYIKIGHFTAKTDVYSFGVVLLVLLTGRKSFDPVKDQLLANWARPMLHKPSKYISRLMDPRLEGKYSELGAQKVASLAYQCLSHPPKLRPTMREVINVLEPLNDDNIDHDLQLIKETNVKWKGEEQCSSSSASCIRKI